MKRGNNGTFAKGNAGGGRPKGSANKTTTELREFVNEFINDNRESLQSDFDALEPKERIDTMIKLMEYALPKLNRTELATDTGEENVVVISFLDPPDNHLKKLGNE